MRERGSVARSRHGEFGKRGGENDEGIRIGWGPLTFS
jgi:hypothetical protein